MSVPKTWLARSEVYGEAIRDWVQLSRYRFDFVTHVPPLKEWMTRLRSIGSRPIPYVTMYQQPMSCTYQGIDLRKHTDWIEVDRAGNWKRTSFWDSEDQKNWYITCPNTAGYVDAILKHVSSLMEAGAAGIFVDNVGIRQKCFGPEYGVHEHAFPDQTEAFAALLGKAREVVRKHDPEGVLLLNSASPDTLPDEFWANADADMAESYICTWVSDKRWLDWHGQWNSMGRKVSRWIDKGKAVLALSYLGHTKNPIKDDAYFCYCSARLSGFLWSAGGDILKGDLAEVLYSVRLGPAVGPEMEKDGIHYREFEQGVIAVNPEKEPRNISLSGRPGHRILDLYDQSVVSNWGRNATVVIPPESGRVYLYEPGEPCPDPEPHMLKISTLPALGNVKFLVDGVETFTHSGRWTTAYEKGPAFGTVTLKYGRPGKHVVEAADVRAKGLEISKGYGSIEKLGQLMDPAEPTKPMKGTAYRFAGWRLEKRTIASRTITAHVEDETHLVALYARCPRRMRKRKPQARHERPS